MQLISKVLKQYGISINEVSVQPLGNGLINTTYLVSPLEKGNAQETSTHSAAAVSYVLQRINSHVFKAPHQVSENADKISMHLEQKITLNSPNDRYPFVAISQQKNTQGQTLTKIEHDLYSDSGSSTDLKIGSDSETDTDTKSNTGKPSYWRMLNFVEHSYAIENLTSPKQAYTVGNALGQISQALRDLPTEGLHSVIKDFHNINHRYSQLTQAITLNSENRLNQCQQLIAEYKMHQPFIHEVTELTPQLPVRLTHNDTKINNLLFHTSSHQPIAVVDLDTCMPGFLMNDFGDMARTCCVNRDENDKNITEIKFNADIFNELAKGYLQALQHKITPLEIDSLIVGCMLQPLMLSMRFLTDYLSGDQYFSTTHKAHNLQRAMNQMQLFNRIKEQRHQLSAQLSDIMILINKQPI